eukprot:PhF_6_TR16923/c0_g1_i1/m.25425
MTTKGFVFLLCLLCTVLLTESRSYRIPRIFTGLRIQQSCPETCCCKVCSDPDHPSYPYGALTNEGNRFDNPFTPAVTGSTCKVSVWKDSVCGFKKSDGSWDSSCPQALWWKYQAYFDDSQYHIAPSTCHCCKLSGVDTSCSEEVPKAAKPKGFLLGSPPISGSRFVIQFTDGYQMGNGDIAELRNDTFCGYGYPQAKLRSRYVNASNKEGTISSWVVSKAPQEGCYRLCYFHSKLTTPTWYDLGTVHVLAKKRTPRRWYVQGVPVYGNSLNIFFQGGSVYDIWNDVIELRPKGTTCGTAGYTTRSTLSGVVHPVGEAPWCNPAVTPTLTRYRPTRYVEVNYTQCPVANRLKSPAVRWELDLTMSGNFSVCYQVSSIGSTWTTLGALYIYPQITSVSALMTLYDSTQGRNWRTRNGWSRTATNPCDWHGIRCDSSNAVVQILLGRNNLQGTIPARLFTGPMTSVTYVALDGNSLSGTIPVTIGALTNLQFFDVSFNSLSGRVPEELGTLPLVSLYLNDNAFSGLLPYSLRDLVDLHQVFVDKNDKLVPLEVPQSAVYLYPPATPSICPNPNLVCPDEGSVAPGSSECGYDGISETECVLRGCCFNAQAPLVFGGKTCFTKVDVNRFRFPQCIAATCSRNSV